MGAQSVSGVLLERGKLNNRNNPAVSQIPSENAFWGNRGKKLLLLLRG